MQDRYRSIAAHLEQARLPFTVDFQYQAEGIRVGGGRFPVLKMRWVEGLSLNQFVEEHLERPRNLKMLLDLWVKLAPRLRETGMAHADLQHGNVLLVPTSGGALALRLIDYDGMYVPALAGIRSGELGHPAYQHPQRIREGIYSAEVDRFSHLAIYGAVRCLMVGRKDLWQRFNNGDNLLFRESDYRRPAESEVFQELWRAKEPVVQSLVGRLILACGRRLEQVPLLEEFVLGSRVLPLRREEREAVEAVLAARGSPQAAASAAPPAATPIAATPARELSPRSQPDEPAGADPATAGPASAEPAEGTLPLAAIGTVPGPAAMPVDTQPVISDEFVAELQADTAAPRSRHLKGRARKAVRRRSRGLWHVAWSAVKGADGLLVRLAGQQNTILRIFLRTAAGAALVCLVLLATALFLPRRGGPTTTTLVTDSRTSQAETETASKETPDRQKARIVNPIDKPFRLVPIAAQTVEAGRPLGLSVSVENADAWRGKLSYRLDPQGPAGATVDPQTGAFSWTPPPDQPAGKCDVTVWAQASDGQTAQTMFTVTVSKAAAEPQPPPGPVADSPKPEKEAAAPPDSPPGPSAAETQWISTARQAATQHKGVLVQNLPLAGGAARIPPEALGRLASQKLSLGLGKLDGAAGQTWAFGQGFENMPPGATREVAALATTTGHGRVDVSLEPRPGGLYLALRGVSQSGATADSDLTRKEEALSKAMATIRGWYTADPGPDRKEVLKTLTQNDVNLRMPVFEPLPAPPPTFSTRSTIPTLPSSSRLSRRPPTPAQVQVQAQVLATQAYEQAKARRKNQIDGLLNKIQKKLEVLKKRAEAAHTKPDAQRQAADQALAAACKSISAVVYPTVVEIEGNHLYQLGDWRLYWYSDRNYVCVWYREGSLAIELMGNSGGSWYWRDGEQEYMVFSSGTTSRATFFLRPWEQADPARATIGRKPRGFALGGVNQEPPGPLSATIIRNFSELSAGQTRLSCDGGQISVVFSDGGTLLISLASPEVLFKTHTLGIRPGQSLKFARGSLALPIGGQ
ncbi:MAG: putative Ig domain-containing protein [Thermoguttaceae bacterium]